jgi:Ran GTPase-activating protein (RanGAP) involved in mRNA processing and transport
MKTGEKQQTAESRVNQDHSPKDSSREGSESIPPPSPAPKSAVGLLDGKMPCSSFPETPIKVSPSYTALDTDNTSSPETSSAGLANKQEEAETGGGVYGGEGTGEIHPPEQILDVTRNGDPKPKGDSISNNVEGVSTVSPDSNGNLATRANDGLSHQVSQAKLSAVFKSQPKEKKKLPEVERVRPTNSITYLQRLEEAVSGNAKGWEALNLGTMNRGMPLMEQAKDTRSMILALKLANALQRNTTLTTLDLQDHNISPISLCHILQALQTHPAIQTLQLESKLNEAATTALTELIRSSQTLAKLNISRANLSTASTRRIFHAMGDNATITQLVISYTTLTGVGIEAIQALLNTNKSLEKLDLRGTALSDKEITSIGSHLAGNTTLQQLHLADMTILPAGIAAITKALSVNTTLTILSLKLTSISAIQAQILIQALNANKNSALVSLKLSDNMIQHEPHLVFAALTGNTKIEQLFLGNCGAGQSLDMISRLLSEGTHIKTLSIRDSNIKSYTRESRDKFTWALRQHSHLTELILSHNPMATNTAQAILVGIAHNTTITTVDMAHCGQNSQAAGSTLSKMLQLNTTIITFKGEGQSWGGPAGEPFLPTQLIQDIIDNNNTIQYLDINLLPDTPVRRRLLAHLESNKYRANWSFEWWTPKLHRTYPAGANKLIITTMLAANRFFPQLPEDIWLRPDGILAHFSIEPPPGVVRTDYPEATTYPLDRSSFKETVKETLRLQFLNKNKTPVEAMEPLQDTTKLTSQTVHQVNCINCNTPLKGPSWRHCYRCLRPVCANNDKPYTCSTTTTDLFGSDQGPYLCNTPSCTHDQKGNRKVASQNELDEEARTNHWGSHQTNNSKEDRPGQGGNPSTELHTQPPSSTGHGKQHGQGSYQASHQQTKPTNSTHDPATKELTREENSDAEFPIEETGRREAQSHKTASLQSWVDQLLESAGYKTIETAPNGKCLLQALQQIATPAESSTKDMEELANYIQQHADKYKVAIETAYPNTTFTKRLELIAQRQPSPNGTPTKPRTTSNIGNGNTTHLGDGELQPMLDHHIWQGGPGRRLIIINTYIGIGQITAVYPNGSAEDRCSNPPKDMPKAIRLGQAWKMPILTSSLNQRESAEKIILSLKSTDLVITRSSSNHYNFAQRLPTPTTKTE